MMMDGMLHPGAAPVLDILYAEDFGILEESTLVPGPVLAEPFEPVLTQADVEAASAAAVAAARDEWERSALQARTQALGALAASLATAETDAQELAETVAESVARSVLSLLASALPDLCAAYGDNEARALVRRFLPTLHLEQRVTVRVHPSLVEAVQRDVALLDEELAAKVGVLPAALAPGDARVTWADGTLTRDTKAICAAMQDVLSQLGLLDPDPITNWRMALAN